MYRNDRPRDDVEVTSTRQLAVIAGALFVLLTAAYIGMTWDLRPAPVALGALVILLVGSSD